jgi:hypothetical protein
MLRAFAQACCLTADASRHQGQIVSFYGRTVGRHEKRAPPTAFGEKDVL